MESKIGTGSITRVREEREGSQRRNKKENLSRKESKGGVER